MTRDMWNEIADLVSAHHDEIDGKSRKEIFAWAKDHGLNTKSKFPKFKTEIKKQLSIDYDALRESEQREREEQTAQAMADLRNRADNAQVICLHAAGDAEVDSFAVWSPTLNEIIWYGTFFDDDKDYDGTQTSADISAMKKALWLAAKAREEAGTEVATFELHVLNHEVTPPDYLCVKNSLALDFHIDDHSEALDWCRENGFKTWRETRLTDLIAAPESR